jgi:hypothetical protein
VSQDQDRPDAVADPDAVRDTDQTSSNQRKTEPVPPSPAATAPDFATGSSDRPPSEPDVHVDGVVAQPPVPSPGFVNDEHGHVAVSTNAAQGTSEQLPTAEGIKTTSLAQPGKPDGEVAT